MGRAIAGAMAQMWQQFQAAQGGATATAPSSTTSSNKLLQKQYSKVEKLGGASDWKEWHFQFMVATRAASLEVGNAMESVQRLTLNDVTYQAIVDDVGISRAEEAVIDRSKGELYSILTLWTKGEPNQIVRNVTGSDGFVAWKKLYDRYNPRTPASMAAAWREVIKTKKMKDMREAAKMIESWEGKVDLLKREHGEYVPGGLKAALLMEMLPDHVQLTVAQGISDKFDYDELKSKIRLMASVHVEMSTPKPMEVDALHERDNDEWEQAGGDGWQEVGAVAKGKGRGTSSGPMYGSCWTCGGLHFSRDCPKGGKGGGKDFGKGEAPGKAKGKGKQRAPMFGSCWVCGGSHFQAECPQRGSAGEFSKGWGKSKGKGKSVREVVEEADEEAEEVGGVTECWSISEVVDAKRGGTSPVVPARRERPGRWGASGPISAVKLRNRFEALADVCEVEVKSDCRLKSDCHVPQNCQRKAEYQVQRDDDQGEDIQAVIDGESGGSTEIVIDSGAAESVCPWNWATVFPTEAVREKRQFRNASGGHMAHYGEKRVRGTVNGVETPISMLFQVSDARNPLASVARITDRGNIVQFGPRDADNYIFDPRTESKVMLRRKGNKFVMDMDFSRQA